MTNSNTNGHVVREPGPFARSLDVYRDKGWPGVLPVDVKGYGTPIEGFTGHKNADVWPAFHHYDAWKLSSGWTNVGLRLPRNVIGIDRDNWAGGGETWDWLVTEFNLSTLPDHYYSTARDDESRIMFFGVPEDVEWKSDLGKNSGIEIIQHGHRWARVWPSTNRKIQREYHWFHSKTGQLIEPPSLIDVAQAQLPVDWIHVLRKRSKTSSDTRSIGGVEAGTETDERFDWAQVADGPDSVPPGSQDELLFEAAASLRAQGVNDQLATFVLGHVVESFQNDPGNPKGDWTTEHVVQKWLEVKERYPAGRTVPQLPDALQRFVDGLPTPPSDGQRAALQREADLRWARQTLEERDAADARGPRPRRTFGELLVEPRVEHVLPGRLAAEVNLLGGPSEAGKSLLARDWAIELATAGKHVLWVAGEGMHDVDERFGAHPLWSDDVASRLLYLDPVNVTSETEIAWLVREYDDVRPALTIFDLIYDMGMSDENGMKDVAPVFRGLKAICSAWGGGVLALGHNGHNGARRFRGHSSWRQRAYVEWHMADNVLSCEKSKIAAKEKLTRAYALSYPTLSWIDVGNGVDPAQRERIITDHVRANPGRSNSEYARELSPILGIAEQTTRKLVRQVVSAWS